MYYATTAFLSDSQSHEGINNIYTSAFAICTWPTDLRYEDCAKLYMLCLSMHVYGKIQCIDSFDADQ